MMIYLVRHAWAGQSGDPRYADDALRPLTEKGSKRFRRMVKKLVKRDFNPLAVATSPLVRARQTAEIIAAGCPAHPTPEVLDSLAPGSRLGTLVEWSRQQGAGDVAWVGHAPDIEGLAAALIGAGEGQIAFEKGAVAAIRCGDDIHVGSCQLLWLATAALLRC